MIVWLLLNLLLEHYQGFANYRLIFHGKLIQNYDLANKYRVCIVRYSFWQRLEFHRQDMGMKYYTILKLENNLQCQSLWDQHTIKD